MNVNILAENKALDEVAAQDKKLREFLEGPIKEAPEIDANLLTNDMDWPPFMKDYDNFAISTLFLTLSPQENKILTYIFHILSKSHLCNLYRFVYMNTRTKIDFPEFDELPPLDIVSLRIMPMDDLRGEVYLLFQFYIQNGHGEIILQCFKDYVFTNSCLFFWNKNGDRLYFMDDPNFEYLEVAF